MRTKVAANQIDVDETLTLGNAPAGDEMSQFIIGPVTHNFGASADAVATKIAEAPCRLEVLKAVFTLIEAKTGGAVNDTTTIAKEAAGTTESTDTITLTMADTVFKNCVGSEVGAIGLGTVDAQYEAGDDIYAYTAAAADRSAGKYSVMLFCKKI